MNFNYEMKNIAFPTQDAYKTNLLVKVESFIQRMRWKAFFFLKPNPAKDRQTNRFNLKSRRSPPQVGELKHFEDDLLKMVENLKFRPAHNDFQSKLKQDIKK